MGEKKTIQIFIKLNYVILKLCDFSSYIIAIKMPFFLLNNDESRCPF